MQQEVTSKDTGIGLDFTESDFMHARPKQIVKATKRPRIYIVWPHANETLGPRVGYEMYANRPRLLDNVDYVCGNILASQNSPAIIKPGVAGRYTKNGTDLNRSFQTNGSPASYEERRAEEILAQIKNGDYDYVLDLHTSTTEVGKCILVSDEYFHNRAVQDMIAASPIAHVVVLPASIARMGLIGNVPNSISIEYHAPVAQKAGVGDVLAIIKGLIEGAPTGNPIEREAFYVSGLIPKSQDPGLSCKNFELCKDGYYPVLFGENTYRNDPSKDYLGFAASRRDVFFL